VEAAKTYFQQYPGSPAEAYMEARGLGSVAEKFRIGYVGSALTGHEHHAGMLVIPYLRPAGGTHAVATVRFRCINDECVRDESGEYLAPLHKENHHKHGKYRTLPGDCPRLYNTSALIGTSPYVVNTEGEFDVMAWAVAGVPATAYQGTSAWRPHFTPAYLGFQTVFQVADDDEPGIEAAEKRAAELAHNSKLIILGEGHDSNSFMHVHGPMAMRERIGI
jgi:DNA primase